MTAPPLASTPAAPVAPFAPAGGRRAPAARKHLPALDGVRGLAILLILVAHTIAYIRPASALDALVSRVSLNTWVGVDLFFVLSGYLITGILLDSRGQRHYFRNFMMRRALRIVPLYLAFLLVTLVVLPSLGLLPSDKVAAMRANAGWLVAFATNVLIALGDWEAAGVAGHLWSIAVEEQFYLVWPLVVAVLGPARLRPLALTVLALGPVVRAVAALAGVSPAGIYTLMPTRADGFAIGALLALAMRTGVDLRRLARRVDVAAVVALVPLLVIAVVQGTIGWGFRSTQLVGYSAVAVLGGWLVLRGATADERPDTGLTRALESGALRTLGKYSYSLYLFHPLVLMGTERMGLHFDRLPVVAGSVLPAALVGALVVTILALGVAVVTWKVIESPALALKRHFPD